MELSEILQKIAILASYGIGKATAIEEEEKKIKFSINNETVSFLVAKERNKMPPKYTDGSFRATKNGKIEYRFRHENETYSIRGKNATECYERRKKLIETLSIEKKETKKEPTLKEWSVKWLKLYKEPKIKFQYYLQIVAYLENYIFPIFGKKEIKSIKTIDIQEFLTNIKSDCTRTQLSAIISDMFKRAYANEIIDRNPYFGIDFKRYEQPTIGALTHQEQILLLEKVKNTKYEILTFFLLVTGVRQGEALALEPQDIDVNELEININKTRDRIRTGQNTTPKTKSAYRKIPITKKLVKLLQPLMNEKRLFQFTPKATTTFFSNTLKKLGLNYTGHITRHTFITNAYELNFPEYIVQKWVGHAKRANADCYLGLRKKSKFLDTEITKYMQELKKQTILE